MTDELFLKRMELIGGLNDVIKDSSNTIMNTNFTHDGNYKKAVLYDWDLNELEAVDIKFQYSQKYSINKDQVEYLVQFRPLYHPEKQYKHADGLERMGFFLDIPDDTGTMNKWLILGRNDEDQFVRYNVLKCNWVFKYIVDGKIYEQLGVLRDRNNYNSGIWSDGFVTSVENQSMFLVPTNKKVELINYDLRFMLSDNKVNPLVYAVSKRTDTYPIGINKITLVQDHYNKKVDNSELGICNYYSSPIGVEEDATSPDTSNIEITFNGSQPVLFLGGSPRSFIAKELLEDGASVPVIEGSWEFYLGDELLEQADLDKQFIITFTADGVDIRARRLYALVGQTLLLKYISDDGRIANLKLEVKG